MEHFAVVYFVIQMELMELHLQRVVENYGFSLFIVIIEEKPSRYIII